LNNCGIDLFRFIFNELIATNSTRSISIQKLKKEELVLEFFSKIDKRISKEKIVERELKTKPIENKIISIIGPRKVRKTFYFFKKFKFDRIFS